MSITLDPGSGITDGTNEGMVVPIGTTAERPENPPVGILRFNTDENMLEVYNGTEWFFINIE